VRRINKELEKNKGGRIIRGSNEKIEKREKNRNTESVLLFFVLLLELNGYNYSTASTDQHNSNVVVWDIGLAVFTCDV
jgi:hypothetical protein